MSGVTIAAPTPWMARAAIRRSALGRQRGARRGEGEERDPGDEHAPAAEAVAERGAGQQQHPVGEDVSVDGPLQGLHRGAEVVVDAGQGDVHDEVVEDDHEEADGDQDQRPKPPSICLSLRFHRWILP